MRKQALTLPYMGQASLRIVTAEGKVVCIDPYGMIGLLPLKLLGKNRGMHPRRVRRVRMLRVQKNRQVAIRAAGRVLRGIRAWPFGRSVTIVRRRMRAWAPD